MINRIIDFSVNNRFVIFFLVAAAVITGWWSMQNVALDAIPDLGDTQVIIYSRWDRSPDIMEDQVTYPIVTSMLGAPRVKTVRGFSDFGYSFVYVIFEDGTDIYWARSRTLEYLSGVLQGLPAGVQTELGPDATGLGWVFQYVLVDRFRLKDGVWERVRGFIEEWKPELLCEYERIFQNGVEYYGDVFKKVKIRCEKNGLKCEINRLGD